ncbi:MAG: N-acetyltransferase, partial [Candidatus Hodarchaeales archaeon]
MVSTNYISKKATIATSIISQTSFIYGPSKIGENSIIDPSVIIGYPIRSTAKEIMSKNVSKS